jgi:hypothetical protein
MLGAKGLIEYNLFSSNERPWKVYIQLITEAEGASSEV